MQHMKPTREVCSSAPERTKYGGRWCHPIGQPECGLEALMGWKPHSRPHARMVFPKRYIMGPLTHSGLTSGVHVF